MVGHFADERVVVAPGAKLAVRAAVPKTADGDLADRPHQLGGSRWSLAATRRPLVRRLTSER